MHKGLKEPHLFNAAANPLRIIKNLAGILLASELDKIRAEIDANVIGLYRLGEAHCEFACAVTPDHWRQRASRLYYAAYNIRRAVILKHDGSFATDSSDHQKIDFLPDAVDNASTYRVRFKNLRDDRNLADYNHLAVETDLLMPLHDYQALVCDFARDAKKYLAAQGIVL